MSIFHCSFTVILLLYCSRKCFFERSFVFQCNRCASIELRMLQCFIFKLTDSKQTVTMLQCIRTNERTNACTRVQSPLITVPRGTVTFTRARLRDRRLCRSVPEGLDMQEMSRISDGPLGLKRFFSLQINTKHTYTCYITLLRI